MLSNLDAKCVSCGTECNSFAGFVTPAGSMFLMGRIPGAKGDNRRMHGEVDEVTVYNRDLLPDEIAAIFIAGRAGKMQTIARELL
jgi:hypothetical protein